MLRRVKTYIDKHRLLSEGVGVIVGLSGGADSVALLDLLLRLGYDCTAVHCNFHLRGEESDRDEQFVRRLCTTLGVTLIVEQFDTKQIATSQHISLEMAARDLRYRLFEKVRAEYGCRAIAVAHHQNDQAETLLLNLCRGTGIRGLAGMKPKNGYIVRPLLCTTHTDILDYLTLRGLKHVEDSTNTDTSILRNFVRQQLSALPQSAVGHIAATADLMQGYRTIVEAFIAEAGKEIISTTAEETRIDIARLLSAPAPEVVLYELLRPYSFPQTDEIFSSLTSASGRQFFSATHIALKDREHLIIYSRSARENTVPKISTLIRSRNQQETYPLQDELRIVVDSRIMEKTLTLRHCQEGDRFTPIGMRGSRKLQDFFTDLHLSLKEKKEVWLLLSGDEIAWVVGYRISDKFKVTDLTKEVAEITILN
ncbi:MAG: tRNA lysidine(34) synthetase TilS [Paludibacteraceae bacterium]|nr:tRNA lysidine(34) synthetase TilS [Paludibacteraceae bacterium]